jgi:DNA primase
MPLIPDDEIERIKRETDLAAVIRSRGIELKPQGGDLIGLCPFHSDENPSLHVTPAKRLWRCVSCHATGNVIQFVQRFDGVSFRHAIELLKDGKFAALAGPGAPVKKSTVPKLENPLAPNADDQTALRQVLDYYHARLKENPAALGYLQKRGITAEAIATFRVGFVDRTLGLRLPQKNRVEGAAIRTRLARLGIIRSTGHEHFRGCVVFPVIAENGEIGTVYGRAIDAPTKEGRHTFLPGPMRGVWNPAALRSSEVIITEGIIDAATWWGAGYRNVTTAYSAKRLPEELLDALLAAKTQRVFLSFDRDSSGDEGTAEAAAQLAAHGVETYRVMFPPGFDANRYALEVTPPDKSLGLLLRSALPIDSKGQAVARSGAVARPALPSMPAASSDAPTRALSSLAAKAAEAAPAAAVPAKLPEPVVPSPSLEAAREKSQDVRPSAEANNDVPATAARQDTAPASVPSTAAVPPVNPSPVEVAKNEPDEIILLLGDRTWTVRGLGKNAGFESLKVTLRMSCAEKWHLDQLDLCVARQRQSFIETAAAETLLKAELVKRDLGHVLRKLEELQEARLKAEAAPRQAAAPEMPALLRERALALLRAPDLIARIIADLTACGLVGEDTNKLGTYLAAVSRLLDRPLAVIVRATTAAGKSWLMDQVLALMPPESRVKYSALTGQALYYLGGETSLKHKILAIVEEEGAEKASYALKLLQSEGELSIASTGKDPHTGRMVTQEYRVEGPVMILLTTTTVDLDEELLNRCIVLTVDESRAQTAAIHAAQRRAETLAGLIEDEQRAELVELHRAAQRLLRPFKVVNPYGEKLTFPEDRTRTRRDHKKYLTLIRAITLLHQYQREVKSRLERGRPVEYIEATLGDIALANGLAHEILGRSLDDMPPQTRALLELIERMVAEHCAAKQMERADARFRARHIREFTGWGHTQLHVHLQRLVELEYLIPHRADHGQGLVYELLYDGQGKNGARFLPGLIDVEKLRRDDIGGAQNGSGTLPRTPTAAEHPGVNGECPGQNGERPAPIRPQSGPVPGGVRPHENGVSSSETATPERQNGENSRPGDGEKDAAA